MALPLACLFNLQTFDTEESLKKESNWGCLLHWRKVKEETEVRKGVTLEVLQKGQLFVIWFTHVPIMSGEYRCAFTDSTLALSRRDSNGTGC